MNIFWGIVFSLFLDYVLQLNSKECHYWAKKYEIFIALNAYGQTAFPQRFYFPFFFISLVSFADYEFSTWFNCLSTSYLPACHKLPC